MTQIKELESRISKFCDDREWSPFHGAKDLAIGLSTEANELLEIFRFKTEEQIAEIFAEKGRAFENIGDEMADVLFFLLRFSQKYEIDLLEAFERKFAKNSVKYPVEKARGKNKKYDEL